MAAALAAGSGDERDGLALAVRLRVMYAHDLFLNLIHDHSTPSFFMQEALYLENTEQAHVACRFSSARVDMALARALVDRGCGTGARLSRPTGLHLLLPNWGRVCPGLMPAETGIYAYRV